MVLSFPEHLKTAIGGGSLLMYAGPVGGEGDGGADQMIILATDNSRERLRSSSVWLSDGTFRTCSDPFKQLYVVFGQLGSGARQSQIMESS